MLNLRNSLFENILSRGLYWGVCMYYYIHSNSVINVAESSSYPGKLNVIMASLK